jgi:hypothetical protein
MIKNISIDKLTQPRFFTRKSRAPLPNKVLTPMKSRLNSNEVETQPYGKTSPRESIVEPQIGYDVNQPVYHGHMKKKDPVMDKIAPKKYISELGSNFQTTMAPIKHVLGNVTRLKMPTKIISDEIHLAPAPHMFHWFPALVNKVEKDGIDVTQHVKTLPGQIVKQLNLGNEHIFMYIDQSGMIRVDVQGPYAAYPDPKTLRGTFSMEYIPPKTHVDPSIGVVMSTPADFKFIEKRAHHNLDEPQLNSPIKIKHTSLMPRVAISDIAPIESKLTNRSIDRIRLERNIIKGQNVKPNINLDLSSRRLDTI